MFVTIINDCSDENAKGRQKTRAISLFHTPVAYIKVENDIEAAGNLIDVLDASLGEPGVVLVNVAPRSGHAKKWANGTPFAYFHVGKTLVVSTIDGYTLSLVKKLGIAESYYELDIPTVLGAVAKQISISSELRDHITTTQFRSFEFAPRVAQWISDSLDIPSTQRRFEDIDDLPDTVWWLDNWGNAKTTLFPDDIDFSAGTDIELCGQNLPTFDHLRDVPDKTVGVVIGSSGYGEKRFIEIMAQGGNASKALNIEIGSRLLKSGSVSKTHAPLED